MLLSWELLAKAICPNSPLNLQLGLVCVDQLTGEVLPIQFSPIPNFPFLEVAACMFSHYKSDFDKSEAKNGNHVGDPNTCIKQNLTAVWLGGPTSGRALLIATNRYSSEHSTIPHCCVGVWETSVPLDGTQTTDKPWTFRGWHNLFSKYFCRELLKGSDRCVVSSEPWTNQRKQTVISFGCVGLMDQLIAPPVLLLHGAIWKCA